MVVQRVLSLLIFICLMTDVIYCPQVDQTNIDQKQRVVLTVFIHGTSMLGITSAPLSYVTSKKWYQRYYERLQRKWRTKHWSYRDGVHGQKGLHPVDVISGSNISPMTMPLINAYRTIHGHVADHVDTLHLYDMFGWGGELLHEGRCRAAIEGYSLLSKRVRELKQQGYDVRLRLVTHSHGGNVALLMAALSAYLKQQSLEDKSQRCMVQEIGTMFEKMGYITTQADVDLVVDEAIFLAMPVLEETAWLSMQPFFNEVWHLYSDNDTVQGADWLSTKGRSKKRLDHIINVDSCRHHPIRQMKIMTDRVLDQKNKKKKSLVLWRNLTRGGKVRSRFIADPNHNDFWIVDWENKRNSLGLLPLIVLLEGILSAGRASGLMDSDVNLSLNDNNLLCSMYLHDQHDQEFASCMIPVDVVAQVRSYLCKQA